MFSICPATGILGPKEHCFQAWRLQHPDSGIYACSAIRLLPEKPSLLSPPLELITLSFQDASANVASPREPSSLRMQLVLT
jgi:hypothetical protein